MKNNLISIVCSKRTTIQHWIFNLSKAELSELSVRWNVLHPMINGLSDHDAQIINLSLIPSPVPSYPFSVFRKTNSNSICKFKDRLSYENWDEVFQEGNVNVLFNNFLNTYLRIFNTCFPTIKTHASPKLKPWLTTGIRTSCKNKCKLYESFRINKNPKLN